MGTTFFAIDDEGREIGLFQTRDGAAGACQDAAREANSDGEGYRVEARPTTIPDVGCWQVPPRNQGQTVERAYGTDENGVAYERTTDRSDRSISYRRLGQSAATWDPANGCLDIE